jgi:hypothetical protein
MGEGKITQQQSERQECYRSTRTALVYYLSHR